MSVNKASHNNKYIMMPIMPSAIKVSIFPIISLVGNPLICHSISAPMTLISICLRHENVLHCIVQITLAVASILHVVTHWFVIVTSKKMPLLVSSNLLLLLEK